MKEELKVSDGTKIERGVDGVKLTVIVGRVSLESGAMPGTSYTWQQHPIYFVAGSEVDREDFDAVCAMLALKGAKL